MFGSASEADVRCEVDGGPGSDPGDAVAALDAANAAVARAQRELLRQIARVAELKSWRGEGARDLAHWLSIRYGISTWKAWRWCAAAGALEHLPEVERAFTGGDLSLDKTVELARFATAAEESSLVRWASEVSVTTVRRRGDRATIPSARQVADDERHRRLEVWWIEEGRRLGLAGELPAAQGAIVVRALERAIERVPTMPDDAPWPADARRADALIALCSAAIAVDADPDRATVVLHARVDEAGALSEAEIEGATAVPRSVAERLVCDARVQVVIDDAAGEVTSAGQVRREPGPWMVRQLHYRDRGCRFPGCGTNAFTQAHHITWWSRGGRTELGNLLLVCSFHHRLVHEHGWVIHRDAEGEIRWITPDGERYRAGPTAPTLV